MSAGRPPIYTPEKCEELADLISQWSRNDDALFLAQFCASQDLWPARLHEIAKESEKFSLALNAAKAKCEARIAKKTDDNKTPTAFGIFALKQHRWTDKTEHEVTGAGGGPLSISIDWSKPTEAKPE